MRRLNRGACNRFQSEIADALAAADEVWVGPIYRADRVPVEQRLDRRALTEGSPSARYTDDVEDIVRDVAGRAREGDVVLILSNGAFEGIYERFRSQFEHGNP